MIEPRDPFDVLGKRANKPLPTPAETDASRARLERAIALEQAAEHERKRRWHWRPLTAVAAGIALILLAVPLVMADPAQAALREVAEAARRASPFEIPEGSFLFNQSERLDLAVRPGEELGITREFVAYHLPTTRRVWRDPSERLILIHTTVERPQFIDPETETAYYAASLDQADRVGETIIDRFTEVEDPLIETKWPSKPIQLREAMEEFIMENRDQPAGPTQLLDLAADLLRETHPSPELKGSLLEVLAGLPLALEEQTVDEVTVSLDDDDRRTSITLSRNGDLLAETVTLRRANAELDIPAGTIVTQATYLPARTVAAPPTSLP